ncbi:MAG: DUF2064 domain-containing protein [Alphaproteobacteria bacterium]|jgi:rSAM/selenodomain-associated transferase 1|nr:DUF2064 domain-containing protein [Alphaproteobacteria bacterium]
MPDGLPNHLVVFAKAPVMGAVKRRLAADIGPVAATRFYRATLAALLRRLGGDPRWRLWLAATPDRAGQDPSLWPAEAARARLRPQGPGDLGARMARMLGPPPFGPPAGPVVLVGSDIPAIQPRHIADAFLALERHALVFGPAADGGFWLAGARRRPAAPRRLFGNVRWSTPHALADTLRTLSDCLALLDTLDDVDDGRAYENRHMR